MNENFIFAKRFTYFRMALFHLSLSCHWRRYGKIIDVHGRACERSGLELIHETPIYWFQSLECYVNKIVVCIWNECVIKMTGFVLNSRNAYILQQTWVQRNHFHIHSFAIRLSLSPSVCRFCSQFKRCYSVWMMVCVFFNLSNENT